MTETLHGQEHEAGGRDPVSGASGAPSTVDYLVGTADAGLSAEIVVGTTPGGELGNTWASPTVDATHSGSTHAGAASAAVTTHEGAADPHTGYLKEADFDDVDFLVGTATGHTAAEIVVGTAPGGELGGTWASPTVDATHSGSTHAASTTTHEAASDPHPGYVLESLLDAKGDLISASADNTPAKVTVGANDTILMADSGAGAGLKWVASQTPSTQAFADAAAEGTADTYARGDHKHAMMADPVTAHAADNSTHDLVHVDTPGDFAINSVTDITINTIDIASMAAGDQLIVDAWFTILNNSTATRNIILTLDFDAAFDLELTLPALAFSSTLIHPVHIYGVLDVRATNLAYAMVFCDMQLAAGIASGTDTTAAATHLSAKGWGTAGGNLTGTVTVALFARSASAVATQTLRLHSMTVRRVTPT